MCWPEKKRETQFSCRPSLVAGGKQIVTIVSMCHHSGLLDGSLLNVNLIKNILENEGESECKKAGRVYRKGVVITLEIDGE